MNHNVLFLGATAFGLAASLGLAGGAASETPVNIVFGTYMPPDATLNANGIIPWLDAVTDASDGSITTQFVGGGAVVTAKNNLFAVRDGLVDGAFVSALYFPNELPVSNLFVNMGAALQDPLAASAALTETFAFDCPACDAEMSQWNIRSLGSWVSPPYDMLCTKEVRTLDDMKGLRVRASGHAVSLSGAIGATSANFTVPELYEALQRGQVDCTFGSVGWLTSYSLSDSAKFDIDLNGGGIVNPSLLDVRADLWAEMSPRQRQILIDAAPIGVAGAVFGYIEQERATLADTDAGITVVAPESGVVKALQDQVGLDVEKAVEAAKSKGVESAPEIAAAFLANYEKWQGILTGDETREEYAEILAEKIYSRMSAE